MKKILIIGSKGMLGQELVNVFNKDKDYEVVAWDKDEIDITDKKQVEEKIGKLKPEIIINSAAYNAVDKCEEAEEYEIAKKVNGLAPGYLAEIANKIGAVFLHYSSDYVFNGIPEVEEPTGCTHNCAMCSLHQNFKPKIGFKENDNPNPINNYGKSKLLGEKETQKNTKSFYIIRLSRLFGKPAQVEGAKKSFFDAMLELGKSGKEIKVVENEEGCFTYAPDLAQKTKEIIDSKKPFGIYHVVNSEACSWYEAVLELYKQTNIKTKVIPVDSSEFPRPAKRPPYSILLNTKLNSLRSYKSALKDYFKNYMILKNIKKQDPQLYKSIMGELKRQQEGLELIASENYVSEAVLEALGSILTNKYSEGYPGKRYYGGQKYIDEVESLAIERAKKLFSAEHVNVQPLSGAPANMIAYSAVLNHGDTVLGMDLSHGGHLTHGHPVTLSAKIYNFIRYKTDKNGKIDYKELEQMAVKHKPKLILAGFSAYTRQLDYKKFQQIAKKVGAISMIDIAHIAGLIAGKAIPNPVPYFDIVTTTTHKTLRGPRGGMIMCKKEFSKAIDKSAFPGFQGGPHENNIGAKAVAFGEALKPSFKTYAKQILKNAKVMEQELKKYNFKLAFGGTDNHMVLVDVFGSKGVTGKEAETVLDEVGITLNKNMTPDDPRSPMDPSGVRIGVPAVTTRGMKKKK